MGSLYLVATLGFFAVRRRWFGDDAVTFLTVLTIDVIVPARLAIGMIRGLDRETLGAATIVLIGALAITIGGLLWGYLAGLLFLRRSPEKWRATAAMSGFQNGLYLPLPILLALLPPEREAEATLLVGAAVLVISTTSWTLGVSLLRRREAGVAPDPWLQRIRAMFTPPVLGLLAGAALSQVSPLADAARQPTTAPLWAAILMEALETLGQALSPLVMLLLGMLIGGSSLRGGMSWPSVTIAGLWRLAVAPALMLAALAGGFLGALGPVGKMVLLVESATPPATNLSLMARRYGGDWQSVSSAMLPTYALAALTLPAWMSLGRVLFLAE